MARAARYGVELVIAVELADERHVAVRQHQPAAAAVERGEHIAQTQLVSRRPESALRVRSEARGVRPARTADRSTRSRPGARWSAASRTPRSVRSHFAVAGSPRAAPRGARYADLVTAHRHVELAFLVHAVQAVETGLVQVDEHRRAFDVVQLARAVVALAHAVVRAHVVFASKVAPAPRSRSRRDRVRPGRSRPAPD